MPKAEFVEKLIKAHMDGDSHTFRKTVMQIAAKEASMGHTNIAKKMRKLIDNSPPEFGQHVGKEPPSINTKVSKSNSSMKELLKSSYPKDRLNDMVLKNKTRKSIKRIISEWQNSQLLQSHGLNCKSKILLTGPPGCGKTMSSKVIASELGLPLFVVKLEGLISRYLGETSVHLRSIFDAMDSTPGVYLFDEFDSIGTTRGGQNDIGEVRRVLSTFLVYMEEMQENSLLIAATNYKKALDQALFRRFDDVVHFPKPNSDNAKKLLKLKLRNHKTREFNWDKIAKYTKSMSYAEITKAVIESIKTSILNDDNLSEDMLIKSIKERSSMKDIKEE